MESYFSGIIDEQGYVVSWNPGAERVKGWTSQEIIGRHFSCFYPQELIEQGGPQRQLEIAAATGQYQEEGQRLRKNGSSFWADITITALRDADGRLRGFAKLTRDITDRRRAEEALRQSEQRWATTLSSIGDAVIATDVEGKIVFMNAVAEALTGRTLRDALTMPVIEVFNIVNEQTRRRAENPVAKVLREGMIVGLANHTILVRQDGTEVPIDDSGAPIRDADGKTMGVVLVFRDITERRRTEEALREVRDDLEKRVEERTAESCKRPSRQAS